jgi:hypothetical protein
VSAWDSETLVIALREREVALMTWGRRTGDPARVMIWIWGDGRRLYIRSRVGLKRDWPQNLVARAQGILHLAGRDIPVRARLVTDPAEAQAGSALVVAKYSGAPAVPLAGAPPTPGETATFELIPDEPSQ